MHSNKLHAHMMSQHSKHQASTVFSDVQPKMVYELTAVILNQIVSGRKSVLDAYGEIIFKAWRASTGACLERVETHLIQNVST